MAAAEDINVDDLRRRARRRLVGAIVLALAVAVFVPMLLESDPKPLGEDVSVKIPPVDEGKFVNKLGDKGKAEPAKSAAKSEPRSAPAPAESPKPEATKAEAAKDEPAKSDSAKDDAPKQQEMAKADAARYDMAKADAAKAESTKAEAPKAEPAKAEAPKADVPKQDASKAAVAAPSTVAPAAAAPAATHAPVAGEFAVQVFAFTDDKGANSLVNKLKGKGFPAYTEPVSTSKGTLWRVRIGPFPTREAASAARDKLKGEGYNGIVAAAK